jgi:serine/threonine protein kinase
VTTVPTLIIDNYEALIAANQEETNKKNSSCWKESTSAWFFLGICQDRPIVIKLFKEAFVLATREDDASLLSTNNLDPMQVEHHVYTLCEDCPFAVHVVSANIDRTSAYPFLITEQYIHHGTLQSVLRTLSPKQLTWRWKLKVLIQVMKFVEHLHTKQYVHMDIKSDNGVIVSLDDTLSVETPLIKLLDFNASREMKAYTRAQREEFPRTPSHSPPELAIDEEEEALEETVVLTETVDIYSVGIVMAEMAAHGLYYDVTTIAELTPTGEFIYHQIPSERPRLSRGHLKDSKLPVGYKALVERCWDEIPEQRPIVKEIIAKLQEMLAIIG